MRIHGGPRNKCIPYEFSTRFTPRDNTEDYISVDPGFKDGKLLAVSDCPRAMSGMKHHDYYTPKQIRDGVLPCQKCDDKEKL